ncbi:unnamed protein product [Nesidiocoris tenuis]|uniref:Solute carrier organic anion transporter family member n=1 Tax=Nesidiocoris tenuis TaxID=355587 RepID=A0A6H5GQI2_9HEMI|nr:unnamed protein product [Nesidiocoris tenuis]
MSAKSEAKENGPDSKPMLGNRLFEGHKKYELTEETTCGVWFLRGDFLQRFANQKSYVFLYGLMGLILSAAYSYFNGTITTIEKRFQIPSQTTGIISVGNDISTLLVGAIITYFGGKGHRPRWMAFGLYTVVLFCLLNALPHFLYGPGDDALSLTMEYGGSTIDHNATQDALEKFHSSSLCKAKIESDDGPEAEGSSAPAIILFISQVISGIGGSLYFTLGVAYMDDNTKKSQAPVLVSLSYFIRMLGPALGYTLSSLCLKWYIAPTLTPKIGNGDPRWLGAWWIGWLLLGFIMFVVSSLLGLFPHTLPKAHYRRQISKMSNKSQVEEPDTKASVQDMIVTFKRLIQNKALMCTNGASIFFFFGYMPYWIFMPKYIEIMYKTSASEASLVTGAIGLVFSALGILAGGAVITKYKPKARSMALWNMTVAAISAVGLLSYTALGCPYTHDPVGEIQNGTVNYNSQCNADCHCDYVKYTPVCMNGNPYISPCHAGCKSYVTFENGSKIFTDCTCVKNQTAQGVPLPPIAYPGPCPADCSSQFHIFLVIICILKFVGATGRATNFLVALRCIDEKDKAASMGLGSTLMSSLAFIPSPIIFGYIIDTTCLVWGKTCSGKGNCWLYNAGQLRYVLSFSAAFFVFIGTMFDVGVWYLVKDLNVFDDKPPKPPVVDEELKNLKNDPPKFGEDR